MLKVPLLLWSSITRRIHAWDWVQTPHLAPLGWSYPGPLWQLRQTPTLGVLTPRGGFVCTLQTPLQVYSRDLYLHTIAVPLYTCCGWILCRVSGNKMKPTVLPNTEKSQSISLVGRPITHDHGLLVAQLFFTANAGFPPGCFHCVHPLRVSTELPPEHFHFRLPGYVPYLPVHFPWFSLSSFTFIPL